MIKERTVYCIGNPHIPEDRLALDVAASLKIDGVRFISVLSPEEIFSETSQELTIMDTAKGIDHVTVFHDLSKLKHHHLLSLHDFDLATVLKLMEGMGSLPKLTIIALPMGKTVGEVKDEVELMIGKERVERAGRKGR